MVRIVGMRDLNLDGLDLNLLVALEVLLRERNVTRAAKAMGISQSGMSHKLRHLREYFADPILTSGRSGLVLSERAQAMAAPLRAALRDLSRAIRRPEPFEPASSQRRFTIAGADYGEFVIMPRMMNQLSKIAPRLEMTLKPPGPDLVERLEEGSIDVAVRPYPVDAAGLRVRKVLEEGFTVAMRADHPGREDTLTLQNYCKWSHLLINPGGDLRSTVDHALAERGLERHIALRLAHFVSAPFIVAASDLYWTGPAALVRRAQEYVSLHTFQPPIEIPPVRSYMIWHERFQADPGHQWLRELVTDTMNILQQSASGRAPT